MNREEVRKRKRKGKRKKKKKKKKSESGIQFVGRRRFLITIDRSINRSISRI